ncbi:uncharacterized protein MELLADRAFT_84188 [Melampsora larici-populina 98AG31]|uniref:RNase H type-1 domain-containing protein n=1 Tax=Melampsora larici-populina (strain 98AG31 / pathotype 3-4-7) TaxID=747676 RepID=F4SBV5_MELLP|nr:uncharacterized protein MELLADRAFT_84188 [Melampsora larici-populina 98AG31]EGF97866.1 hypothetical protein MELLADRAFT_84188 [Melampsora larici-populina 98AG31]
MITDTNNDQDYVMQANETTAIFDDIDKILTHYDDSGGSKNTSMAQLRTQIASVYHYEDPNFLYHFSAVARVAIELDHRAGRPRYPITYQWPDDPDPQSMPHVVLSGMLEPPPTIDIYGVVEGFLERPIPKSPPRFEDLSMFPTNPVTNTAGPPPPPPPVQDVFSVGARTPSPPAAGPSRTMEPSLLNRITFSNSPHHRQSLPLPEVLLRQPPSRPRHTVRQAPIPSSSMFERIDKGKRKRNQSISSNLPSVFPSHPAPAVSGEPFSTGLSAFAPAPAASGIPASAGPISRAIISAPYLEENEHLVPKQFSPISYEVNRIALLYKSDIKSHVSAFNSCKNRPANWQNSLTKDLLEYNFVDLRKFYGAVASSDPPQSRLCINADGDLKNVEGAAPKEITDNNHWQNLLAVLKHAYITAFPPAALSIKSYFKYILSLPGLFQARVHWEDVRDFDAELRKEFASRPSLVWGDYEHKSLKGIDNCILYSSTSKLGRAAIPSEKYQPLLTLLVSRTPVLQKRSQEEDASNPSIKSKCLTLFLWLISLATTGTLVFAPSVRLTATEYTGYAIKMDALKIIKEASLTDEPNACTFLRGLEIDVLDTGYSAAVNSSIHAAPLPSAPPLASDPQAAYAINQRPDLFQINCSINVENLKILLKNHPNKPFVDSIILGLTDRFWPISDMPSDSTVYNKNHASGPEAEEVLIKTRDKELKLNRFSPPFHTLLPGMKVSPLCLAMNPSSGKVRMCTNMSFGNPSPNDLIKKDDIKIDLDGIPYFIPFMLYHYFGKHKFILWKSDVDAAFRNLPVSRQWQFRQIIRINKAFHADRNVNFGCASSPKLWCAFFSLILWITYYEFNITDLNAYMDDSCGIGLASDMVLFKGRTIPLNQAKFLSIFDFINLPWAWEKQIFGSTLDIIGYSVDCEEVSISLPEGKRISLIVALRSFTSSLSHPLVEWQRITGWANWGLNIFPLGRWALQSSWDKIAGKSMGNAHIPLNKLNVEDLNWLANALESWPGRRVLKHLHWALTDADCMFFTDACPTGFGFWRPSNGRAWRCSLPPPSRNSYWAELLAVVSAIKMAVDFKASRTAIFTDSESVSYLFSSHRPTAAARSLFKFAVDLMLTNSLDVKVRFVTRQHNRVADALSKNQIDLAWSLTPRLRLEDFYPDPSTLQGGFQDQSLPALIQ